MSQLTSQVNNVKISSAPGIPAYLIKVLEHIRKSTGVKKLNEIWPDFNLIVYGGTAIASYKEPLEEIVGQPLNYTGVYASTETPLGFALSNDDIGKKSMPLIVIKSFSKVYILAPLTKALMVFKPFQLYNTLKKIINI